MHVFAEIASRHNCFASFFFKKQKMGHQLSFLKRLAFILAYVYRYCSPGHRQKEISIYSSILSDCFIFLHRLIQLFIPQTFQGFSFSFSFSVSSDRRTHLFHTLKKSQHTQRIGSRSKVYFSPSAQRKNIKEHASFLKLENNRG